MEANKTATPIVLPLVVNGSETTTAIWLEDANGKRIITVKNCERDADIASFIVRACNAHDALVKELQWVLKTHSMVASERSRIAAVLEKAGAA